MKIIDAFTFLNEVELVKARLEYLNPLVTDFVIVESNQTWRHQPNVPFFDQIIPTLPLDIQKKIHHVIALWPDEWLENATGVQDKWVENGTREQALVEIKKFATADDWVIMNDLDEFWDIDKWQEATLLYEKHGQLVWVHDNRVCFVDWRTESLRDWPGSKMAKLKDIESMELFYCSKNKALRTKEPGMKTLFHPISGGWHFSKMGDEKTKSKLMSSIREWRTWETKIGKTADEAVKEIFHGKGWNAVSKKRKTFAISDNGKNLNSNIKNILKKYPVLWSNGKNPDGRK